MREKHLAKARQGQPIKPPNFWTNVNTLLTGDKSRMDPKLPQLLEGSRAGSRGVITGAR